VPLPFLLNPSSLLFSHSVIPFLFLPLSYTVFGKSVSTTTTGLYPYNYLDQYGEYSPALDNSFFTPDCHVVENVSPFTLGKSPNLRPLTNTHIGQLLTTANVNWAYVSYMNFTSLKNCWLSDVFCIHVNSCLNLFFSLSYIVLSIMECYQGYTSW
jgi:hypothetical protein